LRTGSRLRVRWTIGCATAFTLLLRVPADDLCGQDVSGSAATNTAGGQLTFEGALVPLSSSSTRAVNPRSTRSWLVMIPTSRFWSSNTGIERKSRSSSRRTTSPTGVLGCTATTSRVITSATAVRRDADRLPVRVFDDFHILDGDRSLAHQVAHPRTQPRLRAGDVIDVYACRQSKRLAHDQVSSAA
jgi:hypothetical protein